jgi:glycogen operon protein
MYGSKDWYGRNGRRPYHSVNFITVHDGFTLYDLFTYDKKQNRCGPLNPICCDQPMSPFCDRASGEDHNRSKNWGDEALKRQMMRNVFTALMISHGTPMILGGDEWMRTQLGNNNAYSTRSDNAFNWYQWGAWQRDDERHRMFDFVKQIIQVRKDHAYAFAPMEYDKGAPLAWKNASNTGEPDWANGRNVMVHYYDASYGPELAVLINMDEGSVNFTLPGGRKWKRLVDTQSYFDTPAYLEANNKPPRKTANVTLDPSEVITGSYDVPSRSIVILRAE